MAREKQEGRYRKVPGRRIDAAILDEKEAVWSRVFPALKRLFHSPHRRRFSGHITTDGVSVSLGVVYPPPGGFPTQPAVVPPPKNQAATTDKKRQGDGTNKAPRKKKPRTTKPTPRNATEDDDPVFIALRQRQVVSAEQVIGADPRQTRAAAPHERGHHQRESPPAEGTRTQDAALHVRTAAGGIGRTRPAAPAAEPSTEPRRQRATDAVGL